MLRSKSKRRRAPRSTFFQLTTKTDLLRTYKSIVDWDASTPYRYTSYLTAIGWYVIFRNQGEEQITPDDLVNEIEKEIRGERVAETWRERVGSFERWLRSVDSIQFFSKQHAETRPFLLDPVITPRSAKGYSRYVANFHRFWENRLRAGSSKGET
jgi:hypothetical protein